MPSPYNYESLKRLSSELGRPLSTLYALSPSNDPFYVGPARQASAEWFIKLWRKFDITRGIHLRRLHYLFVSQEPPLKWPDGTPYENTDSCSQEMGRAASAARYLGLVPTEAFDDRRNPEAITNIRVTGEPTVNIYSDELESLPDDMPDPPRVLLDVPEPTQRYQLEIWAEKTTMNDVLEPLAEKYGINLITGMGELSITACSLFIDRAKVNGRPVRILYISDFDPGGQSMPVAVARKIEFMLYDAGLDLDVQVRPVVLTKEQCEEYDLPRTPIKDTERRADAFEKRHGEGATELDALEALHPGLLEQILEKEISRYHDAMLAKRTKAKANKVRTTLDEFNVKIHERFENEIDEMRKEYDEVVASHQAWLEGIEPVWQAIKESIRDEMPDTSGAWPEPNAGDEDPDPLYDSGRDYVEQMDRYKKFQDKPTERKVRTCSGEANNVGIGKTISKLLTRAKGCTRGDVLEATGWAAVSMQQQARILRLTLKIDKDQKPTRYYAA
jgi:hypothetical protein